jgi:hypothetical protein
VKGNLVFCISVILCLGRDNVSVYCFVDLLRVTCMSCDRFNYLTPFNPSDAFLIYTPIASSRSNSPYLQRPTKASNKLLQTLFYRQVEAWNSLPPALKSASSHPSFKRGLKNIDLSKFLKGSVYPCSFICFYFPLLIKFYLFLYYTISSNLSFRVMC